MKVTSANRVSAPSPRIDSITLTNGPTSSRCQLPTRTPQISTEVSSAACFHSAAWTCRREIHAKALVPAAGKRLVRQILACQQADVDRIVGLGRSVGHRIAPVSIAVVCSRSDLCLRDCHRRPAGPAPGRGRRSARKTADPCPSGPPERPREGHRSPPASGPTGRRGGRRSCGTTTASAAPGTWDSGPAPR